MTVRRVVLALALAMVTAAHASPAIDQSRIGGDAARGAQGRVAINQAAGHGNVQANVAALSASSGVGLGRVGVEQQVTATDSARDASARLDAGALSNVRGLLSVNQAAGSGNAQANALVLARANLAAGALLLGQGVERLDDAALADVAGAAPVQTASASAPLREAAISGDALRGTQGIVQLNQTAGTGNRAANAIVLLTPGGTP